MSESICYDCRYFRPDQSTAFSCEMGYRHTDVTRACAGFESDGAVTRVQRTQVGGDHYIRHGIQPWDIWAEYNLDPWEASALKYLLRRKGKRLEDLEKCRHYLDYLIERERATGVSDGR